MKILFLLSSLVKNDISGETELELTSICSSSHAKVTSKNSFSVLISWRAPLMLVSKSFHLRQNFSEEPIVNQTISIGHPIQLFLYKIWKLEFLSMFVMFLLLCLLWITSNNQLIGRKKDSDWTKTGRTL